MTFFGHKALPECHYPPPPESVKSSLNIKCECAADSADSPALPFSGPCMAIYAPMGGCHLRVVGFQLRSVT